MPSLMEKVWTYYKAKNNIFVSWDQNTEVHTSGTISTTNTYGVSGSVSSYSVVRDYTITVKYEGPVNIGDRIIRKKNIPNYWGLASVYKEADEQTGINSKEVGCTGAYSTFCADLTHALSYFLCLCCCVAPAVNSRIEDRKKTHNDAVNQIAEERMAKDIANIMKEADALVTERLAEAERQQQISSSVPQLNNSVNNNITLDLMSKLNPDLMQAILLAATSNLSSASNSSSTYNNIAPSAPPMLMQYQQQGYQNQPSLQDTTPPPPYGSLSLG